MTKTTNQTILGISAGFHDAAVTVLKDDKIQFASHSERYSKIKHDAHLCKGLLEKAFDYGEPDQIAYYEKPWLKKLRQLYAGQYADAFNMSDLTINHYLNEHFPALKLKESIQFSHFSHHLSHAASSFQTSPFTKATVVVIDAIGEWDTVSIMAADYDSKTHKARYKTLWKQRYPHSIGLFYSAMTQSVGLKPLDEEYILMGMAAYGGKNSVLHGERTAAMLNSFVADLDSAQFKQNLHLGSASSENDLDRIIPINLIDVWPQEHSQKDQLDYDIAASAQTVVELLINAIMRKAASFGFSNNLCYSGGVALNCLANRSLGEYFDNIWIIPNPGDAVSSLGAAALAYGKMIDWHGSGAPYLGHNIVGQYPVDRVLKRLLLNVNLGGGLCGVASGRAEFGPRALGNRSLLADPRGDKMKDVVNAIKQRQAFRPFAPVILAEHCAEYFELPYGFKGEGSNSYMQVVGKCRRPDLFPAIVHVDGTSRVQTVDKDCASGIRWLLEEWYAETGCPMLLNTSLNIRGEPMVNDLSDARRFEDAYGVKVFS
jgi:carbamoyltransferase